MKRIVAMACALVMVLSLAACGGAPADDGKYTIGICQLMKHDALDAATQGFKDALVAQLGEENLTFKDQDAGGEYTNCGTIMDGFVAENVDLILANATAPLPSSFFVITFPLGKCNSTLADSFVKPSPLFFGRVYDGLLMILYSLPLQ